MSPMTATMQVTVLPSSLNLWLKTVMEWESVWQWQLSERPNIDIVDVTAVTTEGTRHCTETAGFGRHGLAVTEKLAARQWQSDSVRFSGSALMWLNLCDTVWIWLNLLGCMRVATGAPTWNAHCVRKRVKEKLSKKAMISPPTHTP